MLMVCHPPASRFQWCLLAAPLLAGNDLTTMSNQTLAILTAPELIEVNQDSLVVQVRHKGADWFQLLIERKISDALGLTM